MWFIYIYFIYKKCVVQSSLKLFTMNERERWRRIVVLHFCDLCVKESGDCWNKLPAAVACNSCWRSCLRPPQSHTGAEWCCAWLMPAWLTSSSHPAPLQSPEGRPGQSKLSWPANWGFSCPSLCFLLPSRSLQRRPHHVFFQITFGVWELRTQCWSFETEILSWYTTSVARQSGVCVAPHIFNGAHVGTAGRLVCTHTVMHCCNLCRERPCIVLVK